MKIGHDEKTAIDSMCQALDCYSTEQQSHIVTFLVNRYIISRVDTQTSKYERVRIWIARGYTIIGIILLCLTFSIRRRVYRPVSAEDFSDIWRVLWILPFVFFGVAARAYQWRKYNDTPWPAYVRYPLLVTAGGILLFAACHSFLELDNWLYYPTSAIVVFWLGRTPGLVSSNIPKFGS